MLHTKHDENRALQSKYAITAWFYDILDYPWERQYRHWRPRLVKDVRGSVLEAGVGTGRNLRHYNPNVKLTGIDLSFAMLNKARKRGRACLCDIELLHEDATVMNNIPSDSFDWLISTFMCCVMPDRLQPLAIKQFVRVLKVGGHFKLIEMIYSKDPKIRKRQERFAPFIEKVYGARFDRNTLSFLKNTPKLKIVKTSFIKLDTYFLIEGMRIS